MELIKLARSKIKVTVTGAEFRTGMKAWCAEQFGPASRAKDAAWRFGGGPVADSQWAGKWSHNFWFTDQDNAALFVLRWSNAAEE